MLTLLKSFEYCTRTIHYSKFFLKSVISFNLSDIGEGIREVVIKEWYIKENDKISQFDPVCEVQSDKASVTISSRYDGVVKKVHSTIEEVVKVGNPLIDIEVDDNLDIPPPIKAIKKDINFKSAEKVSLTNESVKAIPMVRKLAKDHGIDLNRVKGTGKDERITEQDILLYKNKSSIPGISTKSSSSLRGDVEQIKGARKSMIKVMNKSLEIPQFVLSELIEAGPLLELKKQLAFEIKHQVAQHDDSSSPDESQPIKMTIMPIIIKTASLALSKFPILNSRFNQQEETITYQPFHNIGFAVDTGCPDLGLVVPNIKGVESLNVKQIMFELDRIVTDCKVKRRPKMNDLQEGTFTISNIGAIGGIHAESIIMWPEVAIAAIGKIMPHLMEAPNYVNDEPLNLNHSLHRYSKQPGAHLSNYVRPAFFFSISADHRIIDGATVANFLKYWKHIIEHPVASLVIEA